MNHVYDSGLTPICSECGFLMQCRRGYEHPGNAVVECCKAGCAERGIRYRVQLPRVAVSAIPFDEQREGHGNG